jgi:hypothetical protein
MPERPRRCPWENYPTHKKNQQLQVNSDRPIVYGYCAQGEECGLCAGTTYKPNLLLQVGRPFDFLPCPYCQPQDYRRRAEKLKAKHRLGT